MIATPLDELIVYLKQLRDLMPGAHASWMCSIRISQEK